uniref:ATP synthase F0 subunit 8 n=1 Tax=Leptodeira polysticta TaxID=1431682 RepID=C5H576_9SAUR|nr:ATP synthase F0 subunit 8 [Leptodeira polysticta]ACD77453.1 ATP synthase F0 subunit 8 [Leptodeira polysticta]
MPQLDTVYIFFTYLWTWLIIFLTVQKIKTFMIVSSPKKHLTNLNQPTLPWM